MDIKTNKASNPSATRQTAPASESPLPKKGKVQTDEGFEGALALLGAATPQAALTANPTQAVPVISAEALKSASPNEAKTAGAPKSAERSPLTQKAATSLNTATAIAGLKPWSRDWVFQGDEGDHPELQPLFGSGPDAKAPAELLKAGETSVKAPVTKAMQVVPGTNALEGAAAANALRATRGGTEAAALAEPLTDRQGRPVTATPGQALHLKGEAAAVAGDLQTSLLNSQPGVQPNGLMAGPVAAQVAGQLAGMNGVIDEVSGQSTPNRVPQGHASNPAVAGLSGAEFLSARQSVAGIQGGNAGAGQSALGGDGAQSDPEARGPLRVIQGGKGAVGGHATPSLSPGLDSVTGKSRLTQLPNALSKPKGLSGGAVGAETAASAAGGAAFGGMIRGETATAAPVVEVTGHVTSGAMASNRLSSESLANTGNEIRNLTAQGGGEMRIRLRPDNLGELHLRVVTNGRGEVGLQIQASDERAKKVIEDSLSHLKDSLATQSLSLSKVDLTVAGASSAFGSSLMNDPGRGDSQGQQSPHPSQHFSLDQGAGQSQGQEQGRGGRSPGSVVEPDGAHRASGVARRATMQDDIPSAHRSLTGPGRIDVRA